VYSVQKPPKLTKCETQIIGFSDDDYAGVSFLHTDTLVLTLAIANHRIHRILIDTKSSAYILFKTAFELMKSAGEKMSRLDTHWWDSRENCYSHSDLSSSRSGQEHTQAKKPTW